MKNKLLIIGSTVLFLLTIFMVATKLYRDSEARRVSDMAQQNTKAFIRDYSPQLGRADAKVQLVEFLDPECESCRDFYPIVKGLMSEFEGQIQLTIRYAPFHGNSILVIKILEAARKQNRYWETLEVLFQYQPQWGSHHDPRPDLIWTYLPQAKVDVEKIQADLGDPEVDKMIQQEVQDVNALGVRATPTFFVNGKALESFGKEQLRNLVMEELKR